MKQPWAKFYPTDWRQDPALRMCSLAARGMWVEALCLMWQAEPRGSLTVNGKQVSPKALATLVGTTQKEAETLIAELEEAGVFSRDEDGTIFSRRIRRDAAKAEIDRANGRSGGNPALKNPHKPGVNPPDKGQDKGRDKAQKLEARIQTSEDANARISAHDLFRKLEVAAENNLDRTSPTIEVVGPIEELLDQGCDLERHVLPVVRAKIPSLNKPLRTWSAKWLRDEILAAQSRDPRPPLAPGETRVDFGGGCEWPESTVRNVIKRWRSDPSAWPSDKLGPPPGAPLCRVPAHLMTEAA